MPHLSDDAEPTDPPDADCAAPLYRLDVVPVRGSSARVARIAGDLDYSVTPALRRRLLDELAGVEVFVVDLTAVSLLSAAAMEMLIDLHTLCAGHHVQLRIVAATRAVLRPLGLTGLDRRLPLYPSRDAALDQR
ncbi:MAG TPA: STAS domain-containing protein [Jatrophihabitans sp.]|nr:STAS domain-containing protein [Jatrophihabitans sp.]